MATKVTVTLAEQAYAKLLLQYLHDHYSRSIKANDPFLIYAMAAWLHAADKEFPNRLKSNNPFGLLDGAGKMVKFKSIRLGIIGAAKALIAQSKNNAVVVIDSEGRKRVIRQNTHLEMSLFAGALNALKHGGNTGASQFLMWLAYTSWSPSHYGWKYGEDVGKPENNKLLAWYVRFSGLETQVVKKTTKTIRLPMPPRDLNAPMIVRDYLDPWAAKGFYEARHPSIPVLPGLDDTMPAE